MIDEEELKEKLKQVLRESGRLEMSIGSRYGYGGSRLKCLIVKLFIDNEEILKDSELLE